MYVLLRFHKARASSFSESNTHWFLLKKMDLEKRFSPYPDFLKIYNSKDHSHRLVIPSGYHQYFPKPLPQTAVIRKPEGNFWKVKWKITQNKIVSFEYGWHNFVKDNDLTQGDFLTFTYDGSRDFWVCIYRNGLIVKTKSVIDIEEISDDEDEINGNDDHYMEEDGEEKDSHENMIISLSLGTSDEIGTDDDDDDTDDTAAICEINNKASPSSKKRGWATKRDLAASVKDPEKYMDNPNNPFFISSSSSSRTVLVVAMQTIKDYVLNFDRTIKLIDEFGEVERTVGKWSDRVVVYKWNEIYKRNKAKPGDIIICEVVRENDVVRSLKLHFIKK